MPWLTARVSIPYDAKAVYQAQLQFLANALHSGQSPAWNPFTFVGVPQIADPQSFIFSPAILLAWSSPHPSFWSLDAYTFSLLAIAGLAIIGLFRELQWHPAASAVAALCFTFGGSAAWRVQHISMIQSYAFFAVALWQLQRALLRRSFPSAIAAGLAVAIMIMEPNQVGLLGCYTLAFLILARWLQSESFPASARRDLPFLAVTAGVAMVIAAVPIILTAMFLEGSNRPSIAFAEAARGSLHPASLLTLALPDFFSAARPGWEYWGPFSDPWNPDELALASNMSQLYIGGLPAALLVLGVVGGTLWQREIRPFTAATALSLLYAVGPATPFFAVTYALFPGISLFRRPADATFLLCGLLAIVAGYVLHRVLTRPMPALCPAERLRAAGVTAVVFIAAMAIAAARGRLAEAALPLIEAVLWLGAATCLLTCLPGRLAKGASLAALLPVALLTADLAVNHSPSESTGKPVDRALEVLDPDTRNETITYLETHVRRAPGTPWRDRVELPGIGFEWQNAPEAQGLDQTLGYNPLRTSLVTDALAAGDYIAGPDQREFGPLFPSYRSRLADLLGLRYVASPVPIAEIDKRFKDGDLKLVRRTRDAFIYENPRAMPRVMFAGRSQAADFEQILKTGRWPDFEPASTVLLRPFDLVPPARPPRAAAGQKDHPPTASSTIAESTVAISRYENTRIELAVDAATQGYVVLNDVFHPWWRATVDGLDTPVLMANVMFRAVAVPPGRHVVRFSFHPLRGAIEDLQRKLGLHQRLDIVLAQSRNR